MSNFREKSEINIYIARKNRLKYFSFITLKKIEIKKCCSDNQKIIFQLRPNEEKKLEKPLKLFQRMEKNIFVEVELMIFLLS